VPVKKGGTAPFPPEPPALNFDIDVEVPADARFQQIFELTRKKPVPFLTLCDKLDVSPARARKLISDAQAAGVYVQLEHDHVGVKPPEATSHVQPTGIEPTVGTRQRVAVISDLHFGSRYCLREKLKDFIRYAYKQGVRVVLCPGDLLDGNYVSHGMFELSHVGLDNQAQDMLDSLPRLPGLTYHAITGNHDLTFTEQNGVGVGEYLERLFAPRGDFRFYGNRGAFLHVGGAIVHLWHPKGGASYAASYQLQKRVEKYASGEKPSILLAGHWHRYCHIFERGVHAMACPTFQGGGSAFGKALGGAPAIGGMILSWDLTAHGTLRNFVHEYRAYFEVEKPQHVEVPCAP
jgi:predicted phosphodiesterase